MSRDDQGWHSSSQCLRGSTSSSVPRRKQPLPLWPARWAELSLGPPPPAPPGAFPKPPGSLGLSSPRTLRGFRTVLGCKERFPPAGVFRL